MRTLRKLSKAASLRGPVCSSVTVIQSGAAPHDPAAHAARVADVFLQLCRLVDRRQMDLAPVLDGLECWCPSQPPDEGPITSVEAFGPGSQPGQRMRQCEYWTTVHLELARRLAAAEGDFHNSQAARLLAAAIDRSLNSAHSLHALACDAHARNWHLDGPVAGTAVSG